MTISGVNNVEALHFKKDHFGKFILDENGQKQPVDYVSTGNNHHVAFYKDKDGCIQEEVVSFYDAVARVNQNLPVVWKNHPEHSDWHFLFTIKQNEYLIFPSEDFDPNEIDLLNSENSALISPHLFRVQKIGSKDYWFRHHLETQLIDKKEIKDVVFKRLRQPSALKNAVKVRINHLGQIVKN